MWGCNMDYSNKVRYNMILGGDLLTSLVLNLRIYKHAIKECDKPLKGSTAPMIGLGVYKFKYLTTEKFTPE